MILSFIEGTITIKKPAVIQTGNNPFRQVNFTEKPDNIETQMPAGEIGVNFTDINAEPLINNIDETRNDESTGNETKIFEFSGMDSEVTENISVDLNSRNTAVEEAMTVNSAEMDAFRRKYDELMKQLEKERFERELIARSR